MCFSAQADFAVAAALAPVGVATLRCARRRRDKLLAALPLLLAAHQLTEGVVWLGLEGRAPPSLLGASTRIYLIFAQVILPALVPLALLLVEADPRRRRWMAALLAGGILVAARFTWILATHPIGAEPLEHAVAYDTDWRFGYGTALAYVIVTCGPALLSSRPLLRWFGVANLAGLLLAAVVQRAATTSLWCMYAALVSVLVFLHFRLGAERPRQPARPRAK